MANKKHKTKEDKTEVNEPQAEYGDKEMIFFNSFEEMNEYDHRLYASLTPEECLSEVTAMRLRMYPHLKTNLYPWGKEIYKD